MRKLGIIIIVLTIGFLGGYGFWQSKNSEMPLLRHDNKSQMMDRAHRENESSNSSEMPMHKRQQAQTISEEDAKVIALKDADEELSNVYSLRASAENYYGIDIYDVEFFTNDREYNYNIDAASGEIIAMDYELSERSLRNLQGKPISLDEAAELMLQKVPGAVKQDLQIKREHDDHRLEYEGIIRYQNIKYEATIDADTGTIIEWKMDAKRR